MASSLLCPVPSQLGTQGFIRGHHPGSYSQQGRATNVYPQSTHEPPELDLRQDQLKRSWVSGAGRQSGLGGRAGSALQRGRPHCCGLSGRFLPFLICFLIEGLALPAQLPRHYLLPVAQVLASLAWPLGYYLELWGWHRLPLWPGWGPVWNLPGSYHPRGSHLNVYHGGQIHTVLELF